MIDGVRKISSLSAAGTADGVSNDPTMASIGANISAYSLDGTKAPGLTAPGTTPGTDTGQSFGAVLGSMMTSAMDNLKTAETASIGGITGKVSTREVVDSVMAAEQSLQTAITLRDKLVSAFLDITKMQI